MTTAVNYSARRRAKFRAEGLCTQCGREPVPDHRLCRACAERSNSASVRYRESHQPRRNDVEHRRALGRRWCRIAIVAGGAVVWLHPLDRIGLSVGTVRSTDLADLFGVHRTNLSAWRTGRQKYRSSADAARAKVARQLARMMTVPLRWEEHLPAFETVRSRA